MPCIPRPEAQREKTRRTTAASGSKIGPIAVEAEAREGGPAAPELRRAAAAHALRDTLPLDARGVRLVAAGREVPGVARDEDEAAAGALAAGGDERQVRVAAGQAVDGVGDQRAELTGPYVRAVAHEQWAAEEVGPRVDFLGYAGDAVA
jgi:hypothetical protein